MNSLNKSYVADDYKQLRRRWDHKIIGKQGCIGPHEVTQSRLLLTVGSPLTKPFQSSLCLTCSQKFLRVEIPHDFFQQLGPKFNHPNLFLISNQNFLWWFEATASNPIRYSYREKAISNLLLYEDCYQSPISLLFSIQNSFSFQSCIISLASQAFNHHFVALLIFAHF